jgi:hypothetical protein
LAILLLRDVPFWQASRLRRALRLVAFAAYAYLGVLIVLLWLENRLLFPGSTFAQDWVAPSTFLHVRDVELDLDDGTVIHAWWSAPPGWRPADGAILYSHGNGGNLSGRQQTVQRWQRELTRAVLIYDYPGYGKSTGRPTEAGCYAAAEAAHAWLVEEQKVAPRDLILLGSSLGAVFATHLAVREEHRALILINAFTSFPDMAQLKFPWLPARWLVSNQMNNLERMAHVQAPVFIAHGEADRLVPFSHGERLFAAAREPKRFFPMPNHGHWHPAQPEFFAAVRAFLDETKPR